MPLRITYECSSRLPLDMVGITPEDLRGKKLAEVERLPVRVGNALVPLAEFCRVSGDPGDGCVELAGDFSHAHHLAAGMNGGILTVEGPVGNCAGLGMTGGQLHIHGDAGDLLGCEMRGGLIRVAGSAGNQVGGAQVGSTRGMRGGTILVHGNAGDSTGARMRRGLIAIGGSVGALVGHNMLAGTIVVRGECGPHAGAGMKRGTLWLLGTAPARLVSTFRAGCESQFSVLSLLTTELESLGFSLAAAATRQSFQIHHGDFLQAGRGEVFVLG